MARLPRRPHDPQISATGVKLIDGGAVYYKATCPCGWERSGRRRELAIWVDNHRRFAGEAGPRPKETDHG